MRKPLSFGAVSVLIVLLAFPAGCNRGDGNSPGVTASVSGTREVGMNTSTADGVEDASPATPQDSKHPVLRIQTSLGAITVELDAESAPLTVRNFLWYAENGHYQQTVFHQVLRGYVAIGGGYSKNLSEKPTHIAIRNEADNHLKNLRGTIAMARRPDVIDSSTDQFFFNLADNPNLDQKSRNGAREFGYCVFGRVTEGMDVLDKIATAPVDDTAKFASMPVQPIVITSVTRVR